MVFSLNYYNYPDLRFREGSVGEWGGGSLSLGMGDFCFLYVLTDFLVFGKFIDFFLSHSSSVLLFIFKTAFFFFLFFLLKL